MHLIDFWNVARPNRARPVEQHALVELVRACGAVCPKPRATLQECQNVAVDAAAPHWRTRHDWGFAIEHSQDLCPTTCDPALHGARRHIANRCDLVVRKATSGHQDHSLALLVAQAGESTNRVRKFDCGLLLAWWRKNVIVGSLVPRHLTPTPTALRKNYVAENSENPGPDISTGSKAVARSPRPCECFLHHVVRICPPATQPPRARSDIWNKRDQIVLKIAYVASGCPLRLGTGVSFHPKCFCMNRGLKNSQRGPRNLRRPAGGNASQLQSIT